MLFRSTCFKAHGVVDKNYPILRIGVPKETLPDRVLLNAHVAALGKELFEQKAALETQQAEIHQRVNIINPLLAKNTWCEETQLSIISNVLQEILRLENQAKVDQQARDKLIVAIEEEKASHPEYEKYLVLSNAFELNRKELETLGLQLISAEKIVNDTPSLIQSVKDEVKKHAKYAELRQKESELMSEQFLKGEVSKAAARKMALNTKIQTLTIEGKIVQQTIDDYEKKSSVARFFSGKTSITQAQSRSMEIRVHLPQSNDELQRQNKLEQHYQSQLEELLFLKEQIKSVIPSKTKDYWEKQIGELSRKFTAAETEILTVRAEKENLSIELDDVEKALNEAKKALSIIRALETKLQEVNENLGSLSKEISIKYNACSERLERECSLCNSFHYSIKANTNDAIHGELSKLLDLLDTVKSDLTSHDIPTLQSEKAQLENQLIGIYQQLNEIKQKMQELEKQAIMNAQIVGATLVKSYLSDTIRERSFDTVIIDEASTAPIPALWCASYLAEKSIIIVGDFLQIGRAHV